MPRAVGRSHLLVATLAVVAALLLRATPAKAQVLQGVVTAEAGGPGLAGVVLELTDSLAARVTTAITGARGQFALRLPRPGTYRVEARRIGFRRRTLGPFTVGNDTSVALVMEALPQSLPAVTASDRTSCARGAADATAASVLWESANTALLASSLTLRDGEHEFELARHRREYALSPATLNDVQVDFARLRGVRPWTSLSAEELAVHGFVHLSEGRALAFVAPDLELLTSAGFAASHCFTVTEDARRPGLVGLEFQPPTQARIADVRGTLWLDRESLELRTLTFTFTGVNFTGADTLAGGYLTFARLPDGAFLPSEWAIRSPVPPNSFLDVLTRRREREQLGELPVPVSRLDPAWHSNRVVVTGGTVLALRRRADSLPLWRREAGEVKATVRWRRGTRAPAAGVRVQLLGLGAAAFTDEQGNARFTGVPPGEYVVTATSEEQEFLQLPRDERVVRVESGAAAAAQLTVLNAQAAMNSVCEFNGADGVLAGIVSEAGRGTSGARIRVDLVAVDAEGRERLTVVRTGWSGGAGLYHICRVPRGRTYLVTARLHDSIARARVTLPRTVPGEVPGVLVRLDLGLSAP